MDGDHTLDEYEEMQLQVENLRRQNEILRMENKLRGFRKDLEDYSGFMSTPTPGKPEPALGPKTLWSTIPKGRPDVLHGIDTKTPKELSSHEIPDRFVTTRKPPTGSTSRSKDVTMKPATFDGSVAWMDYKAHFEACAELNGWNKEQKGLYLSVSLRGQAQGVFGNLGSGKHDYDGLVTALEERFAPPNQTELYRVQLRERRQKASETMAELGQDIRRLTNLAYPKAPSDVRETLAKEQFVDSLVNSEVRLKIKQARPVNLNDAVRELEAFYRAENKQMGQGFIHATTPVETPNTKPWDESFSSLRNTLEEMTKTMNKFMSQQQRNFSNKQEGRPPVKPGQAGGNRPSDNNRPNDHPRKERPRCFNCNSDKHFARFCPKPKPTKVQTNEKEKAEPEDKGSVCLSSTNHAGLFVRAKLANYSADCLVDTGATLTLISNKVWSAIKGSEIPIKFDKDIISASGNVLDTKGRTKVCFEINGINCVMDVVIVEMDVDAIIGLDFMFAHDVNVDVVSMTMTIRGKICPLIKIGKVGCYRVIVKDGVPVPSRSEVILEGKLVDWNCADDSIGVLESAEEFLSSNRGVIARTVVKAGDKVPIRYANLK